MNNSCAVTVVVLVSSVWCISSTQQVHYVQPDGSSPLKCPAQPCLTLYEYTQHTGTYFTTGSTFIFLAGNHSLVEAVVNLTNIPDVTFSGERNDSRQVNVLCKNCTFLCDNTSDIIIERLMFMIYSHNVFSRTPTAIKITSSRNIIIRDCIFQKSEETGRAITVHASRVEILNCIFNKVVSTMYQDGAIYARNAELTVRGSRFIGNRAIVGGAISTRNVNLTVSGSEFVGNRASHSGGALYIIGKGQLILEEQDVGNVFAHNSALESGGAISCSHCTISGTRNCTFQKKDIVAFNRDLTACSTYFHNNTSKHGGAISAGAITLNGANSVFVDNRAWRNGGAIDMLLGRECAVHLSGLDVVFEGNEAGGDGGAVYASYCHVLLGGRNIEFTGNKAHNGGAMAIENSGLSTTAKSVTFFISNTAMQYGGAVFIRVFPIPNVAGSYQILLSGGLFVNNSCEQGGAVYINNSINTHNYNITLTDIEAVGNAGSAVSVENAKVLFGECNLTRNTGNFGGGILCNKNSVVTLVGHTSLVENNAINGGGIYSIGGTLSLNGDILFSHNTADRDGGALYAAGTDVTLNNRVNFTSNAAQNGGAMFISATTSLTLNSHTTLTTSHNHAYKYGGAIYHEDRQTSYVCDNLNARINENHPLCFLKLGKYEAVHINSRSDSADRDGSFLYGGLLDKCRLPPSENDIYNYSITPYDFLIEAGILHLSSSDKVKAITSEPYALCFCDGDYLCHNTTAISISRGQKFVMSVKAIAQGGATSTQVTAYTDINARTHLNQVIQTVNSNCTRLEYNFYSSLDHDELRLTTGGSCGDTRTVQAVIRVTLLPCPHPFVHDNEECACDKRLLEYPNVNCITDQYNESYITKKRSTDFWVSISYDTNNGSYEGLILYKTCPPEYCKTQTDVSVSLDNLDSQCDDNRGGVLCGQCLANYSLMLGSSKCRRCSNQHLVLLLPFAAAGIALVVFLSIFRLTVATATLHSIILYANILQAFKDFTFPVNARNVLTVFLAWMNLDLGFETCFYDGMTAYAQTWLQFAFPLYVWLLISFIILSSRYSITVSKLIGHNPIAVLATLLLMSYTKLLKIIIAVYSSVDLDYPDNQTVTVWLKDANVPYLESWHLFLTVVTTLFVVLFFLPYSLLLLLGYKLYRFAGRRYLRWVHRVRPLLESYYAPYNIHTRYWTGFLLLVRCALYITFSTYSLNDTDRNLLAIILTFTALLFLLVVMLSCFSHQLYTKPYDNIIEVSTYLNLIVISAATLACANPPALVYSLVGLVFVTMLGIIIYHFHLLYIAKSQVWQQFKVRASTLKKKLAPSAAEAITEPPAGKSPHTVVTHSEIVLRESLLFTPYLTP